MAENKDYQTLYEEERHNDPGLIEISRTGEILFLNL